MTRARKRRSRAVQPMCAAVWDAAPTEDRPELRCEKAEHDEVSFNHFDGIHEVLWSTASGHPEFVGADPFRPETSV